MVSFSKWVATLLGFSSWVSNDDVAQSSEKRQIFMYQVTPDKLGSSWEAFESDLYHQWDAGVTHSVFGWYSKGSPTGLAHFWSARMGGSGRERAVHLADKMGVKILLSIGGPEDFMWFKTDASVYVKMASQFAKVNLFHGLDFHVDHFNDAVTGSSSVKWLIDASKTAHETIGLVTHTPRASYFTQDHSRHYLSVLVGSQEFVSHFMIRYFDEQTMGYTYYDDIFAKNKINRNSITQIEAASKIKSSSKLGVVKGFSPQTVRTGFVPLDTLKVWYCKADVDPKVHFEGAIGFWERDYSGARFGSEFISHKLAGFSHSCKKDALPTDKPIHSTLPPTTTAIKISVRTVPHPATQRTPLPTLSAEVKACRAVVYDTPPCQAACQYYHEFSHQCNGSPLIQCVMENAGYCDKNRGTRVG